MKIRYNSLEPRVQDQVDLLYGMVPESQNPTLKYIVTVLNRKYEDHYDDGNTALLKSIRTLLRELNKSMKGD